MKEGRIELNEQKEVLPSGISNLLLIKSNGGFGKTTRMKEYLRKQGNTAVWMDLDSECNQKEVFTKLFWKQIQIADLHGKVNRPKSLYDNNAGFSIYKSRDAREEERLNLIFKMVDKMDKANTVLIFDNVHVLWNQEVLSLIENLVKQCSECKIFLLGRQEPAFLVKYIISGQCKVIGEKQLFLKKDEVVQMIISELGYQAASAHKLADDLLTYFEGWPAGIGEVIRYLKEEQAEGSKVDVERVVMESWIEKYIQYEVFQPIPSEELWFLKMLSMLPEYEEELESELYRQSHCEKTLQAIHKEFFFLVRRQSSYLLIPAFQRLLKNSISSDEAIQITRIFTDYYFSQDKYEKANAYILKGKDSRIVEDYFNRSYEHLQRKGKVELCIDCILFLIRRCEPLSGTFMWCAAEIFNADYDGKQLEFTQREDEVFQTERQFYMTLLSYNKESGQYKERLQLYFEKVRHGKRSEKKVSVQCFGYFSVRVLRDGKELTWRTKKGCELFAFLHHMQGKPIAREVLLDVLWPDTLPKNAVTMLHNMIYNIRKELSPYGLEEIIQYKNKMYRLNMDLIESDLDGRKELYHHAGDATHLVKQEELCQKYPGQYLENIDGHWTTDLKEFYDKKYMECCMCLADNCMDRMEYGKALAYLKDILSVDELREDAVEKMLYCLGKMGERKAVRQEYHKFMKLIRTELNVEPCENVKEMYEVAMRMGE